MNIHIANLSRETSEGQLRKAFEAFGKVEKASLVLDKVTGKPSGFAFVEMPEKGEADAAIAGLHKKELNGQVISLKEVAPVERLKPGTSAWRQKGGDPFQKKGMGKGGGYKGGGGVHAGAVRRGGKRGT
jgi:RNA recognition motif-containing protein